MKPITEHERAWEALEKSMTEWRAKGIRVEKMSMQLIGAAVRMLEKDYPLMAYAIDALMRGFESMAKERAQAKDTPDGR